MHPRAVRKLCKEHVLAAGAGIVFLFAVKEFAATGPQNLTPGAPYTSQPAPRYVPPVRPSLESNGAPQDIALVRHNAFAPVVNQAPLAEDKIRVPLNDGLPTPPTQEADPLAKAKSFPPVDLAVKLNFAGVIVTAEKTVAMVTEKDGDKRWELRVGDYIPEHACTVTRIEKQSISLADDQQRTFILSDGNLAAAAAALENATN
jgi:hypothetical protein